jgi:short-subunit dehydrogenase
MNYDDIKKIWIIGASTGIGEALAKALADEGKHVIVSARSEDKLKTVAGTSDNITAVTVDVTDPKSISKAMKSIKNLDSVIQCAGWFSAEKAKDFDADLFKKHFDINVQGTANILDPVLKRFKKSGKGHIGIVSSVAGYHGLPKSLSYGPTKAALINLCEALAIDFYDTDIKIQVINPGFVKTPLTDQNDFEMPMIITPEEAAKSIIKGLKRGSFEITFPKIFSYILKTVAKLPYALSIPLIKKATAGKM